MQKLLTLIFVFLPFFAFVQSKTELKKPKQKKHICSEYLYRYDTYTRIKDTVLIIYCVYDTKKKKTIHKY